MFYTPGGRAYEAWHSATQHETVVTDARDRGRIAKFDRDTGRLAARIPTRTGNASVIHRLNQASHAFPPAIVWLVIGLAAFLWRRPRHALIALAPTIAGLIVIVASSLVAPSVAEYGAPVTPAFLMLAAVGAVGVPVRGARPISEPARRRLARATPLLGAAVGIAAAAWTIKIYYDGVKAYVDGAGAQQDLAVFLRGAGKVLHSASPYVYDGDKTFAYPPFLLTVAAAWRWRDRVLQPAAAVGVAIVLKLFLWPLAIWLALMRRMRAAVGAIVVAIALAAAAWVARDERRPNRDRDVATLTLTLAAALAASPIVWVHYFLLLLVPLALTRPRLSLLWFVPLAYYPLGEAAWPGGDARKLALALVATLVILGAAVIPRSWLTRYVGSVTGKPSRFAASTSRV